MARVLKVSASGYLRLAEPTSFGSGEQKVYDLGDGESWVFKPGDLLFEERFNKAALSSRRRSSRRQSRDACRAALA
jgi:hypothetical protein